MSALLPAALNCLNLPFKPSWLLLSTFITLELKAGSVCGIYGYVFEVDLESSVFRPWCSFLRLEVHMQNPSVPDQSVLHRRFTL